MATHKSAVEASADAQLEEDDIEEKHGSGRRMTFGSFSGNRKDIDDLITSGGYSAAAEPARSRSITPGSASRHGSIHFTSNAAPIPEDQVVEGGRKRIESDFRGPKTNEYGIYSHYGMNERKENQDTFFYVENFGGKEDATLFGVMDGHGRGGAEIANITKDIFYNTLLSYFMKKESREVEIHAAFIETQKKLEEMHECQLRGTTATICLVSGFYMYVANAGDSRAILGRECAVCFRAKGVNGTHVCSYSVTVDHKVENMRERERILKTGGTIRKNADSPQDCLRVWKGTENYPGIVVTRTFGDLVAHSLGISSVPDIRRKLLDKRDKVVIIASDGVWDVVDNQDAINLVVRYPTPDAATEALVDKCLSNWRQRYADGDNITAVVVFLGSLKRYDQDRDCSADPAPVWEELTVSNQSKSSMCSIL